MCLVIEYGENHHKEVVGNNTKFKNRKLIFWFSKKLLIKHNHT